MLLVQIIFALTIINMTTGAQGAPQLAKDQTIRLGNGAEPRELDPSKATGSPEGNILDNLFEGLTGYNPLTMESVPGAAESWKISDDKTTYTFKIRKGLTWSDGQPITAEDFVWSWIRTLKPETASEYAYQLYYIKNGEGFNLGKIKDPKKLGVKAKDKATLIVTLENPTPFFLQLTAFRTLYPIPRHVIEKHKDQNWTKPGNIVTNGPFVLKEWKINKHVLLVKNPKYWNAKSVKLKQAYLQPIENQDTEERTFFAGKLHASYEVPNLKIPLYMKQKKKDPKKYHPYRSDPYLGSYYYRFNVTKPPLNDKRVRRALALAIDRTLIVERITKGGQKPAGFYTPPNTAGYTFPKSLPTSASKDALKEAKSLLAQAGFADGKGFPKLDILYNTSENHKKIAIAIQQMWKKNLSIEVGLYNQEWKVYLNNQKNLNYQVSRSGWIGDYPDPNTFLDMFVTGGGNNSTGWSNKKYDSLIKQAAKASDSKARFDIFKQAEGILMDELPIMPIYFYTKPRLVSEKLKMWVNGKVVNYTSNIQDQLFLKNFVLVK